MSYEQLLDVFWHNVDPLDAGGQFCDRGDSYRTAIFAQGAEQRRLAEASKQALDASGRLPQPIVTPIVEASTFYPAEDYHQDYYVKNPVRYKFYRWNCGRDQRLAEVWGDGADPLSGDHSIGRCGDTPTWPSPQGRESSRRPKMLSPPPRRGGSGWGCASRSDRQEDRRVTVVGRLAAGEGMRASVDLALVR